MSNYTAFAEFYDQLTDNVDYKKRAEYFCKLLERHGHTMGLTLDLACGTGSLTIELAKRGQYANFIFMSTHGRVRFVWNH